MFCTIQHFPQMSLRKWNLNRYQHLRHQKQMPTALQKMYPRWLPMVKKHPYGEVQTEKTVNSITLDKCKEYYNTYFKPNNAYLVIRRHYFGGSKNTRLKSIFILEIGYSSFFQVWNTGIAEKKNPKWFLQTKMVRFNRLSMLPTL